MEVAPSLLENFKTGVLYHFVHTLALLGWALWHRSAGGSSDGLRNVSGRVFLVCALI